MEQSIVPLIPLMLDRQRFLRLDISALCQAERDLSDFWGKKTSVYACLLDVPISINDLSILVLHGLRHEDPTLSLPEVRGMLNHSTIPVIYQAVTDAWTKATQAADPDQAPEGCLCGPFAHVIDWGQLWAYARVDLGLSEAEFWRLTLYELDLLALRHRRKEERADRRAALAAMILANVHRDSEKQREPFTLEYVTSWLGYSHQYVQQPKEEKQEEVITVEKLKKRLEAVYTLHRLTETQEEG